VLVVRELPEDSQFPNIDKELPEVAKYASLWATKDAKRICDSKIFCVLVEMNIQMWISGKSHFSQKMCNNLQSFVDFKADMRNIFIRAHKDLVKKWTKLPFVAIDDAIFTTLEAWPQNGMPQIL